MEEAYMIKGTHNCFIHRDGYVFRIDDGREVRVKTMQHRKTKNLGVEIRRHYYGLLNLMLEYFLPDVKAHSDITYHITRDYRIPLSRIVIKSFLSDGLTPDDLTVLSNFKCNVKASAANKRAKDELTPLDVYLMLKHFKFKCIYCNNPVKEKDWHLDHYIPLSTGGRNVRMNVVPSCSTCNLMKGAMQASQFFNQCKKVSAGFIYQDENNKPTT